MKKIVTIQQRDLTDCGAACLASVATHYRLKMPVSRIRQYAGTDKKGTNVLGLVEAAERLGFQVKAAKGPIESLSKIPLPAIAHIIVENVLHHFVVIYRVTSKQVIIMDPADGAVHKKKLADFAATWTGVIILLLPGESFEAGKYTHSNYTRFWQLIRLNSANMLQAFAGALVYTVLGLSTSVYLQKLIDHALPDGNLRLLTVLSVAMILILLFQAFIGAMKTLLGLQSGQQIDARLILGYYKHLWQLPQRFFDTMRVGEIISRVNDAVKIRVFINDVALNMIVNGFIVVFSAVLMFFYYWKLAMIMLVLLPVYFCLYAFSNAMHKKWQRTLMEKGASLETQLVESLNAAGTIKRFGLEAHTQQKTENAFIILLQSIYKSSTRDLYLGTAAELATHLFTIIILWAGSYYVINREMSPGELLSFYALAGYFTGPASSLIAANKQVQDALIAADRLFEIIDLETETQNEHNITLTAESLGDIVFQQVHFRYGTRVTVFAGLNICLQKNKMTAIVGESGSGKSTLLSLLQNLYPLQEGTISIGGIDLAHISHQSLRQIISVVPQQVDLFAGTIIENIALGDAAPDMQKILRLSQSLGIDGFVDQLPAAYHTLLHEQGVNLSGGQRQRIAIARALYRDPEILILDEATSSLDPESERKVQSTLAHFRQRGKTIIIIAHRLSTIQYADTILVLKQGRLAEQGTHTDLLAAKGMYYHLWEDLQGNE